MKKPDLPLNESARLSELRSFNIMDSSREKRFDRITRIASKIFDAPIALVSLIDSHRQWHKSSVGLETTEIPREISFCGHAILDNKVFIVEDAEKDIRFADNPLVEKEPHIRFYAGCPLRTIKGTNVGTLCILDQKPRKLSRDQLSILKDLALMVERELELTKHAIMDELTKIPNRRGFKKLAEQSLNLSRRSGLPSTLVYLDLDNFKKINEQYGYSDGDKILMIFASNIKKISRDADIFARFGKDEFVILFIDTPKKSIDKVITRFKEYLQRQLKLNNLNYEVLFTHGAIEFMAEKHQCIDDMLKEADNMMCLSKSTPL